MLVAAMIAVVALTLVPATPSHAVDLRTQSQIRDGLEARINRARRERGLRPLRVSLRMESYADSHAVLMAARGTLFHDSALKSEVVVGASSWGENVGYTSSGDAAASLHRMFMGSSGHRANILKSRWTHMGVGVAKRNGRVYAVERFADAS